MALFLTPRFTPAYQQCGPRSCTPALRPQYIYRRIARPSVPDFVPFLSQFGDLLSELDREVRQEAQRQQALRRPAFRAHFKVHEDNDGYLVEARVPGFEQDSIAVEVPDAHTLRVSGTAEQKTEQQPQTESAPAPAPAPAGEAPAEPAAIENVQEEPTLGATAAMELDEVHSDTTSIKSYQATVEDDFDDFEDLGAETSSVVSASSSTLAAQDATVTEKAVDEPASTTTTTTEHAAQGQPQPEAPAQQQQQQQQEDAHDDTNRFVASFDRTFRFPERIDGDNVRASLKDGVLSVIVPKEKAPARRKIAIQ